MKKIISLILCLVVVLMLAGCGSEDAAEPEQASETETTAVSANGVDVDLTVLSSTMVYSEVYNMMSTPEDYFGKTVKMGGKLAVYYDENTGKYYYYCIIADAAACCSQGIEFALTDEYSHDDYPEEGSEICVVGVFDKYKEGDYTYYILNDSEIV